MRAFSRHSTNDFARRTFTPNRNGFTFCSLSDLSSSRALVSAAEATKHLRIGTTVLNNDLRHPVLVAREAATLDLLTDGRFELGLGAGSIRSEYDEAGLRFDRGATRVDRLAEAVAIIKALLEGQRTNFVGQHYRVSSHAVATEPVQKPRPPILIGGNGLRLLALAAREADIVGFSGITFQAGGRSPPDLSAWRVSGVDERVRLVHETAGKNGSLAWNLTRYCSGLF